MTARARLPNRRQSETLDFEHGGHRLTLSLSRFPGGTVEALARDAAMTASLAFQYGYPPEVLRAGHDHWNRHRHARSARKVRWRFSRRKVSLSRLPTCQSCAKGASMTSHRIDLQVPGV
jgi:hypothetical protein